ncbi:6-pyruvoyl trahydropterin synthase family protein [Actinomadura atramentaria]|uniref:6-pyruvoyl trahydropterin synthase family protein n=1 Tax=Actinomadura atramentaria TaxID=1990 RepID=UPI00036CE2C8|nr:6-carboxytetrahydropterin synthase [Actinomadura atramentaria]
MFRIAKTFAFEAAHRLGGLPPGHKCGRPHGHSYAVEVRLAGHGLAKPGFVVDFAALDAFRDHLRTAFDHRDLNEVLDVEPTSEHLARHLFQWCAAELALPPDVAVEAVRVAETAATWAEYGSPRQPEGS